MKWKWYALDRRQFFANVLVSALLLFVIAIFAHITALIGMQPVGLTIFVMMIPIIFWQIGPRIVIKYIKPSPL